MATTTPNYGWPVPTSTDYVKDGATAIEALGDAIDATVFGLNSGLVLVKTQTIGTTVSSVDVTDAFSATYDNYKILINGGVASTTVALSFQLGATATGYNVQTLYGTYANTPTAAGATNQTSVIRAGGATTSTINFSGEFLNPFLTKETYFNTTFIETSAGGVGYTTGYQNSSTSFTSIKIIASGGTLTGGTVRVYGYKNS